MNLFIFLLASLFILNTANARVCHKPQYFIQKLSCSKNEKPSDSPMACFAQQVEFTMGTNEPFFKNDGEAPARLVKVDPFCIDKTEVSNAQFAEFVAKTKYRTEVTLLKRS